MITKTQQKNIARLVVVVLCIGFFSFVIGTNTAEAKQYKVSVGGKSYYVRSSGGPKTAASKARRAVEAGRVGAGCGNVSGSIPSWWSRGGPGGGTPPTPPPDVCPNLGGHQSAIPANHRLVGGNCIPDQCVNINGFQESVPSGLRDVGGRVCQINDSFGVFCRANPNPAETGSTVTFVATPFYQAQGDITYVWYQGTNASGSRLRTQTTDDVSSVDVTFSSQGNQRVTVVATDAAGNTSQRTCGVTVADDVASLDLDGDGIADDLTADGDSGIDDATLELNIDRTLTNNSCELTWNATNVIECFLANTEGKNDKVDFSGSEDVVPGTYFLRCLSHKLNILQTEERVCRLNPDIREV